MLRECDKNSKLINPVTKRINMAYKVTSKGKKDAKKRKIRAGDCDAEDKEDQKDNSLDQDLINEYKEFKYSSKKKN